MKSNIIIIGGGIVGLATAYKVSEAAPNLSITILEKEMEVSSHQTGNNSGVIHSGLYYKPGSLKAKNCITGYADLINFAEQNSIPYERCGKIVVATEDRELATLNMLFERGRENGLEGLKKLTGPELKDYEPHVNGVSGIFVPQTGIIDYRKVTEVLARKIRDRGKQIVLDQEVKKIIRKSDRTLVLTDTNEFECDVVVSCSGLHSDRIARMIHHDVDFRIIPFRGEYYKLKPEREHLVKNLIYPVPDPNFPFLGVHFTRMINGGVEAGPNAVLAFAREGYKKSDISIPELLSSLSWPGFQKVARKYWKTGMGEMYRSFSKKAFTRALQRLIPEVQESDLIAGGAGVRAQACDRRGGLLDDFLILENEYAVTVCNAPSPAATSALSIGNTIAQKVIRHF